IHHPAGDIKKISTFSSNLVTSAWNGNGLQSHWRVVWTANSNGHGVTEGGSSGSPIFRSNSGNSVIMGTLTGGGSFCNAQSSPDYYGKMSYHWTSNGTPANEQLKTYLDPNNTGTLVLFGSADPCSAPQAPVADFVANQTTVAPATTVNFTDLSSGTPTSWSWTVTPGTGWAYAGGTSATSQNPQITFNTVGTYTVALTATNAIGSDTETKTNYIIVSVATTPCGGTSSNCDEYISNVSLNTINNNSACTNYGNYTSISTTLNKGAQYTVAVTPFVTGQGAGAYPNDEVAVWIDWNDDLDFTDAGEQVGYVLVAQNWSNQFTFTVPTSAVTGSVTMRCRISYQPDDGAIQPCGTSQWGEVEDYTIQIQPAPSGTLTLQCPGNQTIYATQSTTVPNITASATSSSTCPGGSVTETQSPAAGSPLQNGANTITVTATDQCGNVKTCTTVITYINNLGVEESGIFSEVELYPNPVSGELTVDLSSVANEDITVELYDLSGKLLTTRTNNNGPLITIDMTNFANGLYHLKLRSNKAQSMRKISKF
ncbi:MAG: GEVED domain-containing protein, partial [Bacteroidota bacterium]